MCGTGVLLLEACTRATGSASVPQAAGDTPTATCAAVGRTGDDKKNKNTGLVFSLGDDVSSSGGVVGNVPARFHAESLPGVG